MKSHYAYVPLSEECKNDLKAVQETLASNAEQLQLRPSGINGIHFTLSVFKIGKST